MPARDVFELLDRARALGGSTLAELAQRTRTAMPIDPRRAKGFVGELVERAMGAARSSRPEPDFAALGVELKTLPIGDDGQPRESTFVCTVPRAELEAPWERSRVRHKLARVLFVPVEASPAVAHAARRVGSAFVWSPDADEEATLRADWEELSGLLLASGHEHVSARHGRALQLRPKGANAAARVRACDADGAPMMALPRAFYLRRTFVASILAQQGLATPAR